MTLKRRVRRARAEQAIVETVNALDAWMREHVGGAERQAVCRVLLHRGLKDRAGDAWTAELCGGATALQPADEMAAAAVAARMPAALRERFDRALLADSGNEQHQASR